MEAFWHVIAILFYAGNVLGGCHTDDDSERRTLTCNGLVDGDLPLSSDDCQGRFQALFLFDTNLTLLPTKAFGSSASFCEVYIEANDFLVEIEEDSFGINPDAILKISIANNAMLS